MAVAPDAVSTASGNGVTSISWSHTCTGTDRAIFVGMSHSGTITGVTYAGVAMTAVIEAVPGDGAYNAATWKLSNPASGANTVVVTFSASATGEGGAFSVTGAHQTTASLTSGATTSTGLDTTPTITIASATGDMVFGMTASNQAFAPVAPGTGGTELWDIEAVFVSSWAVREDGAASVVIDGTATSFEGWNMAGFNIVAAAAGGATTRGTPFGSRGNAFNGGRTFHGIIR